MWYFYSNRSVNIVEEFGYSNILVPFAKLCNSDLVSVKESKSCLILCTKTILLSCSSCKSIDLPSTRPLYLRCPCEFIWCLLYSVQGWNFNIFNVMSPTFVGVESATARTIFSVNYQGVYRLQQRAKQWGRIL